MELKTARINNRTYAVRIVNERYSDTQAEVEVLSAPFEGQMCIVNHDDIVTHSIEVQQLGDEMFVGYPRLGIGVDIAEGKEMMFGIHKPFYRISRGMELLTIRNKKDSAIRQAKLIVESMDMAREIGALPES